MIAQEWGPASDFYVDTGIVGFGANLPRFVRSAITFHFGWLLLGSLLGEGESCGNIYWGKLDKFSNVLRQKKDGERTFARHAERWFGGEARIFNLLSYRNDVPDSRDEIVAGIATTAVSYSSDVASTIRSTAIFTSIPFP